MMKLVSPLFALGLMAGCAPIPTEADGDHDGHGEHDEHDHDGADGDDDHESGEIETVEEYLEVYCTYAVGCSLWMDIDSCAEEITSRWFGDCEVVDVESLNVCADWISGLSCSYEGWIDACDSWFSCS